MKSQKLIRNDLLWENSYREFKKVCSPLRTRELFEWLYTTYNSLFLSSVESQYITTLADIKTSLAIVDVAVDDACDNEDLINANGGEIFTRHLLKLLYNIDEIMNTDKSERIELNQDDYYRIAYNILENTIDLCKKLPRFYDFKNEFILSLKNVAYSMEFSYIVNSSKIIYPFSHIVENRSASCMVEVHSILDLMCSNDFDENELGKAIPLFKMADTVAMLSNTIYTWPREIIERDYSSPVLALALEENLLTFEDFDTCEISDIETKLHPLSNIIENHADDVLNKMKKYAKTIEIHSFNAFEFVDKYIWIKEEFKARGKYWAKEPMNYIDINETIIQSSAMMSTAV